MFNDVRRVYTTWIYNRGQTIMTSFLNRIVISSATLALAAGRSFGQGAEDLRLTIGKSVVIDYPSDIRQVYTSNPDILDASPITTREILLHGNGLGSAALLVWSK